MGEELLGDNATLVWDGLSAVQLRYRRGWLRHKSTLTAQLLAALGERTVPVEALTGVELRLPSAGEPQLRLLLRPGSDPLLAAAGEELDALFDPYRFCYRPEQELLAEYYAQEIDTAIRLQHGDQQPAQRFLVAPPPAADELKGFDGKLRLDGSVVRLRWGWTAAPAKTSAGRDRTMPLADIETVEWRPMHGSRLGHLRLRTAADQPPPEPKDDPNTLLLGATHQVPGLLFAAVLLCRTTDQSAG